MTDLLALKEIAQNTTSELRKASYGETSSISFIKHAISKKSRVLQDEPFQILVIGGTVCRKAIARKTGDFITLEKKTEFQQPPFNTSDNFLTFVATNVDKDVSKIALNFAYPLTPHTRDDLLDGYLIRGTKENSFSGLEHQLIGESIETYFIQQQNRKLTVCVANDVICLLLSGKSKFKSNDFACGIVGTGINFAFFADNDTAVNLESANFSMFPKSKEAGEIDKRSSSPGKALFEKEVAGAYLYLHLNEIIKTRQLHAPMLTSTKDLKDLALSMRLPLSELAYELIEKSASYVAAHMAGITEFTMTDLHFVMEGGFFWGDAMYKDLVQMYLPHLTEYTISISQINDSPYIGASYLL